MSNFLVGLNTPVCNRRVYSTVISLRLYTIPLTTYYQHHSSVQTISITKQRHESSTATLLCDIRAKNRVFRKACAQVVLLNLRIEDAKTHYLRARATGNLAFRYSYRMKLTSLEGVRDSLYDFAVVKCEEIEALQARLHEVTGAVVYIVADEDSSNEDWSVAVASIITETQLSVL